MEPVLTLVDSNVLIDIFSHDAAWGDWSRLSLMAAVEHGGVAINAIIYAEVAAGFATRESLDEALADLTRIEMLWIAGFLAGQVFRQYRVRGGANRYRTYFPTIDLIAPS